MIRCTSLLPEMAAEIERLEAELATLKVDIEAGRLVRLPCAVGDTVYIITENFFDCQNCPHKAEARYSAKVGRICCDLEECHCPREVQERFVFGFNVDANGASAPGEWGYEGLEPLSGIDGKWYHTEAEALAAMKEDAHE
jgi:hypothetical protein